MSRIITLISRKSGAGKTTIASNLAAAMASGQKLKTGLIDLDPYIYDTAQVLSAAGDHTVNAGFVEENYFVKKAGFYLFWTNDAFDVLKHTEKMLDVVVIDAGAVPDDELIEASDRIIITTVLTQPDIRQASVLAQKLLAAGYPAQSINVVVNKADNSILSAGDVQAVFRDVKVLAVLPYKKDIEDLQAKGEIYFTGRSSDPFSRGIGLVAEALASGPGREFTGQQMKMPADDDGSPWKGQPSQQDAASQEAERIIKKAAHVKLFDEIDVKNLEKDALTHPDKKAKIHAEIKQKVREILDRMEAAPSVRQERDRFVKEIFEEVVGLGAIEDLLNDRDISEVMVNRHDLIYIEKKGKLIRTPKRFTDDENVLRAIERIVMPLGRRIDESMPYVDARLPDGSRVNAIIPPLAIDGPVLTIRKFSDKKLTAEDLINFGSLTKEAVDYLMAAVVKPRNILISGGTGSGKTTLLNVLSSFIPEDERIITVEDSAELKLTQEHVVRLEARPANIEGKGAVSIRDLVRNCLRMRPDRIVVGECRGGETLDMLQAMNTGHEGSMTTVHANTPRDALSRIDVMVLMAGVDLPLRAIREQVRSAINVIIQQARLKDGSRKITHISEVTGMEGDNILMHDVFRFLQSGEDGQGRVIGELKRVDRI
jgi:pilus assembly protein CpaF